MEKRNKKIENFLYNKIFILTLSGSLLLNSFDIGTKSQVKLNQNNNLPNNLSNKEQILEDNLISTNKKEITFNNSIFLIEDEKKENYSMNQIIDRLPKDIIFYVKNYINVINQLDVSLDSFIDALSSMNFDSNYSFSEYTNVSYDFQNNTLFYQANQDLSSNIYNIFADIHSNYNNNGYSSFIGKNDYGKSISNGINGIIINDLFKKDNYQINQTFVKMLCNIIEYDNIYELYFNDNIYSFINSLNLVNNNSDINNTLINNTDEIHSIFYQKEKVVNEQDLLINTQRTIIDLYFQKLNKELINGYDNINNNLLNIAEFNFLLILNLSSEQGTLCDYKVKVYYESKLNEYLNNICKNRDYDYNSLVNSYSSYLYDDNVSAISNNKVYSGACTNEYNIMESELLKKSLKTK